MALICRKWFENQRKVVFSNRTKSSKTIWGLLIPCWDATVLVWLLDRSEIQIWSRTDLGPIWRVPTGFWGMIEIENGAQKNLLKSVHDAAWYFAENEFGSENSMVEIENGAHNLLKSIHDAA